MKITYYAVKNGKKNGIYRTWDECKVNVLGFPGAEYKGFCSDTEAKRYLDGDTKVPHETIYASPVCNKPVVVSDSEQTKVQTAASAGEILTKFKFQIYHNEANGFSVCKYDDLTNNLSNITCTGLNLPTMKNITYSMKVTEETNKYGKGFKVSEWQEQIGKTHEDIVAYLSCGFFAGISQKIAERVYDMFGQDTLSVLDTDIDSLSKVSGIGKKTLAKIKKSYTEKRASRDIARILIQYDFPLSTINRIYSAFKMEALNIIKLNPYELCNVHGVTFPMADSIAKSEGFADTFSDRIKAASDYVLREDMTFGNVCMPKMDYARALIRTLASPQIGTSNILNIVLGLMKSGAIKYNKRLSGEDKEEYFYYPTTYKVEREIAELVLNILETGKKRHIKDIDVYIDKYAKGIELDETQREAVKMGVTEPLFIITGGPGTGKTTILKIITEINQEINKGKDNNVLMSPTGRAARRMAESTGYPARTIHSRLELGVSDDDSGYDDDEEPKIQHSRVMIDEASMIDLWLMDAVLENMEDSSLGLIGDIDQLPSVRCGSILRDLIKCGKIPCIQLDHIHRQADDAKDICENAMNIKHGIHQLNTGSDFDITEAHSLEDAEKEVVAAALADINEYGIDNVRVLCPFKKNPCGVYSVNNILQAKLNPLYKGDLEFKIPNNMSIRVGDPVMQLKNIDDVSNGDIGTAKRITKDMVIVEYPAADAPVFVEYSHSDAREQLTLAYAMTVHKSQGSEYDAIVTCLTESHGRMKKRNILYTALTRGKHHDTLVGTQKAFYDAIDNDMVEDRHSFLAELINPDLVSHKTVPSVIPMQKESYTQMKLQLAK